MKMPIKIFINHMSQEIKNLRHLSAVSSLQETKNDDAVNKQFQNITLGFYKLNECHGEVGDIIRL